MIGYNNVYSYEIIYIYIYTLIGW